MVKREKMGQRSNQGNQCGPQSQTITRETGKKVKQQRMKTSSNDPRSDKTAGKNPVSDSNGPRRHLHQGGGGASGRGKEGFNIEGETKFLISEKG